MKTFFPLSAVLLALSCLVWPGVVTGGEVILQDDKLAVAFDAHSGALTHLENRVTHWIIERRPELGVSFQLTALTPEHATNLVHGARQPAAEVVRVSDHEVNLRWTNLVSDQGAVLPITLGSVVTLTNGMLTFTTTVENDSPLMVESVDYPSFGELNAPLDGSALAVRHMYYADLKSADLGPLQTVESKQSLFCLIQAANEGIFLEMQDPTQPYLLRFIFEPQGAAPSAANPPRQTFRATHVAYVHPHAAMRLAPVVLAAYRGDWHAGVDLYKTWRATWFKQPYLPAWIQDVNSWQQLQICSPEQDFRVPYTNLVKYARQCADSGVGAIQLVGWNHWGQDGGDPAQDIEPGLGTWQQLHDAIARIQGMGVKMILFAKLNWADLTMPWYTNELYKYQCTDPAGNRYLQGGYSYFTPTQLAGIGIHRRAVMDFQDPDYRAVATGEFKKILALGSAGWLWDEVCHHAGVYYNYAPHHGYVPPGYLYGGDLPLGAQLRAAANEVSPDFLFAGEGPEDWLLQYFPCSYVRINAASTPVSRYIDSQTPLMVAVTGFDDREILNLILLERYIISYEPYNFKGYLTDFPLTLAYGKKIDALRRRYKAYLWDGEFRDTLGAQVSADGAFRYSVFVAPSGKRAVVVANMEFSRAITVKVDLPNAGKLLAATPEEPRAIPSAGTLPVPARSAVVLMEQ